jgi:hypothetical protein
MPGTSAAAASSGSTRAAGQAPVDLPGAFSAALNDATAAATSPAADPNELELMPEAAADKDGRKSGLAAELQLSAALLAAAKSIANMQRTPSAVKPASDKKPKAADVTQPVPTFVPQQAGPTPPLTLALLQVSAPPPASGNGESDTQVIEDVRGADGKSLARQGSISGRNPTSSNQAAAPQDAGAAAILDPSEALPQMPRARAPEMAAAAPIAFELKLKPETAGPASTTGIISLSTAPDDEPAGSRRPDAERTSETAKPREFLRPLTPARQAEELPPQPSSEKPATATTMAPASPKAKTSDTSGSSSRSHDETRDSEPERTATQSAPRHTAANSATDAVTAAPAAKLSPELTAGQTAAVSQPTQTPAPPLAIGDRTSGALLPSQVAHPPEGQQANPAPAAAASDIRVEVPTDTGKVDVRVIDRGGDVHVAVRTADGRLAGEMRDGLPALSARLEASGFRSDSWRPSAETERRPETPATARTLSPDRQSGDPNRGRHQNPQQQQNPRGGGSRSNTKAERNDFAWLFTSVR